jgi:hypothetical protein
MNALAGIKSSSSSSSNRARIPLLAIGDRLSAILNVLTFQRFNASHAPTFWLRLVVAIRISSFVIRHSSFRLHPAAFALLCLLPLTGCVTSQPSAALANYQPDNIHRAAPALPKNVQRVALLPIACDAGNLEMEEECEALVSVLSQELIATKKFEVIRPSRENLHSRTGRGVWSGLEALPAGFFEALRDDCGCDAVFFCELTAFRPYSPMAIGWRCKLVDVRTKQILWATDEVFDASLPAVANAAHQFDSQMSRPKPAGFWGFWSGGEGHWAMLNSPRRFGQYTVASLLTTLPDR